MDGGGVECEDIEDLLSGATGDTRLVRSGPLVRRSNKTLNKSSNPVGDSFLPGTQSVYVKTWGCAHNNSDSEYMAGLLSTQGYKVSFANKKESDVWLLNSCTVKSPAEDHFRNEVEAGLKEGKKVVVAGCVPQGAPKSDYLKGLSVIGVQQIDRVVEVVEEALKGNSVRLLGTKKIDSKKAGGASLILPKIRKNPLVEIIAINTGCLNQCTYCKTKHARGVLGSYPPEEIVARAKSCFEEESVVEIWLTSEDTGAYGRDIGTDLPQLLWKLTEIIPEGCRLRLGMTNPPYIMDHLDEMAKILNHPRVYKFLHVPVQSGSDAVLRDMKREYSVIDFSRVIDTLRSKVPGITIATDIIAGFPTETDEDFKETVALCRKYRFPSLFINQFFARPGTPAAKLERVASTKEVKKRTKELSDYFQSYEPFKNRVGKKYFSVLVTETSHDGKYLVGHNEFYEQILVPKDQSLLGKCVNVEIFKVSKFSMMGKLTSEPISANEGSLVKSQTDSSLSKKGSSMIYKLSVLILFVAVCIRIGQLLLCAFEVDINHLIVNFFSQQ